MNREDTIARLEALEADLTADLEAAQTRGQHIAISQRVNEVQRIVADLRTPA